MTSFLEVGIHCVRIFGVEDEDQKNWQDARNDCEQRGGDLASIHSSGEFYAFIHYESTINSFQVKISNIKSYTLTQSWAIVECGLV